MVKRTNDERRAPSARSGGTADGHAPSRSPASPVDADARGTGSRAHDRPEPDEQTVTDAEAAAADGEPRPAPGEAGDAEDEASALREELEEVQAEKLRLLAEFRNFRQRMERERLRIRTDAACGFFSGLLPIVHDLERARDAVWGGEGEAGGASIGEGIDLVLKRLADFMRREGVVEVDPIGEPFHEGTMEAMGMIPSETHAEGRVAQVFQKGLLLGERLIEPARVLVSSGPATDAGADDDADDAQ